MKKKVSGLWFVEKIDLFCVFATVSVRFMLAESSAFSPMVDWLMVVLNLHRLALWLIDWWLCWIFSIQSYGWLIDGCVDFHDSSSGFRCFWWASPVPARWKRSDSFTFSVRELTFSGIFLSDQHAIHHFCQLHRARYSSTGRYKYGALLSWSWFSQNGISIWPSTAFNFI